MLAALNSLVPVLLIIAVGAVVRQLNILTAEQWSGVDRIAYYVLFPAIIIATLARADFASLPTLSLGLALFGAVTIMAGLCLALRPLLARLIGLDGPSFTSVFQGATRWNAFVALAMAASLHGQQGVSVMAVALVAMIPVLNLMNVAVLAHFASGSLPGWRKLGLELAKNPFIWSCAVGLLINLSGVPVPAPAMSMLEAIGRGALPVGLLAVGAGLNIRVAYKPRAATYVASALRLVLMPILAASTGWLFGVGGMALSIAIIATAVPTANAAYLLARQMGGNAELMAEITTVQTLLAILTLPVAIALFATPH